jgi:2-dehydropantoate 2-reductase
VLVAVKSYSLADVAPAVRTAAELGADVIPLLNGVTAADELIAAGVPKSRMLGGLARVSAVRTEPGVVERRSAFKAIVLGELGGGLSDRAVSIAAALRSAGIDARASETMTIELWQKFVFITAMAAVCGLARSPIGPVRDAPEGKRLILRAVSEVVAVARARGIKLPDGEAAGVAAYMDTLPATMTPSFLLDLESGGPTELATLSGAVSRFAATAGIETPVHDTAVAALSVRR